MSDKSLFWCVSLTLSSPEFLDRWHKNLKWQSLPKGPLRFLVAAAIIHWEEYEQVLDRPSLMLYLEAEHDEEAKDEIIETFDDLEEEYAITDSSFPLAWEQAEKWIQNHHLSNALDKARTALTTGDRQAAFEELLNLHEVSGEEKPEPAVIEPGNLAALLEKRHTESQAIPTGLREFDDWWEGGIYPGNFGIVISTTNLGKSQTLCYFAAEAYKANKKVFFFTYELTKQTITERILTSLFQCPKQDLDTATVDKKLLALREGLGLDRASIVVENGIETTDQLRRRIEEDDVDIVLLDSADDIQPRGKHQNLYSSQGEIYTDIAINICQRLEVPVWTSTQATREAVDKAFLSLRNMGDSFIKARRAHLILGMSQTEDELNDPQGPLVRMGVMKDTIHGSRGKKVYYSTSFGRGDKGWPGFSLHLLSDSI